MKCAVLLLCLVLAGTANAARPAAEPHNELVTLNESRCQACTDLLSLLQTRLQDPTMQQQLMQYVIQDVCPQLPQSDRTQCSLFAPLVIASAIGWVREQSPVTICTRVSLCPATVWDQLQSSLYEQYARAFLTTPGVNATVEKALLEIKARAALTNDDCDICKIAVVEMATILADPDTQKSLLNYAKDACGTFPAFEDQCEAYVEAYGPIALATAIAYMQPALCSNIGFCPPPAQLHALQSQSSS